MIDGNVVCLPGKVLKSEQATGLSTRQDETFVKHAAEINDRQRPQPARGWRVVGVFLLLLAFCWPVVSAAELTTSTLVLTPPEPVVERRTELFRIGYLRREETGHPGEVALEALRRSLENDTRLQRDLEVAGYRGIGLYSCDGAADMQRRLNAREFDLAFTPANVYNDQQARYTAILKARRPRDIFAPPPSNYVRRLGVVFVSPRSPLFRMENPDRERLRTELQDERLAVVSTQSVAGFNAPLLALAVQYDMLRFEGGYLWFENSSEVVKGVLSGLADVGACEAGALDDVLVEAGLMPDGLAPADKATWRSRYVRILLETDPVVTDPIVVRPSLAPRVSALGRTLRERLAAYSMDGGFGDVQYRETTDDEYRSLRELLTEFNSRIGEVPR